MLDCVCICLCVQHCMKLSNRDCAAIDYILQSAGRFLPVLRGIMRDQGRHSRGSGSGSPTPSVDRAEVGMIIRDSHQEELYKYGILLAAVHLLVEGLSAAQTDSHSWQLADVTPPALLIRSLLQSMSKVVVNGTESDCTSSEWHVDYKQMMAQIPPGITVPPEVFTSVSAAVSTLFTVLKEMQVLHHETSILQLKPLHNGNELLQLFQRIPYKEMLGTFIHEQLLWQLNHPDGTKQELLLYLKDKYANYV